MKPRILILIALISVLFASCGALKPVQVVKKSSLDNYSYFYITPTEAKNSSSGGVFGFGYGVYGISSSSSTNPADIISGFLIKKGLVRLPEIKKELASQTMIINYGETGKRQYAFGHAIEVTLQIISAQTNEIIYVVTGEGYDMNSGMEADNTRIAIERCLKELYK